MRRGEPDDGLPSLQTVLVHDTRRRSGDTAAMARVIARVPFNDSGDTSAFDDNYSCQLSVRRSLVELAYTRGCLALLSTVSG
jgi:hypothetical protein